MNPFRSVGARLSVALAVVVAGALAVVWIALVPTLERRLVDGKIAQLAHSAQEFEREAIAAGEVDQDFVDDAARTANARVVYFRPISGGATTTLLPVYESQHLLSSADVAGDRLALRASETQKLQRGRVERGGEAFAEAAVSDANGNVLLLIAPLRDTLQNVQLVRTRLLWAGLAALALALAVGFGAAAVFGRRLRRLERAAGRIASGDFDEPVTDRGRDEVGQLARAFDRMRLQLAQLDDARRAFIANASHELRTPIFSLGGFLELLEEEDLDEDTRREFIGTMVEQVQRLAKLAGDLLDLSKLDSGRVRPDREPLSLGELAEELRAEFAAVALQLEHPLEATVAAGGTALGDRERVLRIGRALVDNALHHTPAGTAVRIIAGGSSLAVEDAGPGIPLEYQEQVFTRFTRLEGSRAAGTGLGLAIARELAGLMGGALRLESQPGRTVFTLELPVAVAEPPPAVARV